MSAKSRACLASEARARARARECQAESNFQATVLASYVEIYNEKLFDLLVGSRDGRTAAWPAAAACANVANIRDVVE